MHIDQTSDPPALPTHEEIRQTLSRRYGIRGELVGVPALAAILDMSPSTVHTRMKNGSFEIPHLRVNRTPKVRLDQLAAWLLGGNVPTSQLEITDQEQVTTPTPWEIQRPLDPDVARAVAETLKKLGAR